MKKLLLLGLIAIVIVAGCIQPTGQVIVNQTQSPTPEIPEEPQTTQPSSTQPEATEESQETQQFPETVSQPIHQPTSPIESQECRNTFVGIVEEVIDGDTLNVKGCNESIRLALVDAPERYEIGFEKSKSFAESLCKVGSQATIDQDSGQPYDVYGRIVALVYCQDRKLNAELIYNNLGIMDTRFCDESEFANEDWAKNYCFPTITKTETENCDPSYPTLCIPSPPPDLDCSDIPYRNFDVLPPDPHRFDGDKDGIGCET